VRFSARTADFGDLNTCATRSVGRPIRYMNTYNANYCKFLSGTSMATPYASGAAALVLARYPTLRFAQLRSRLNDDADPIAGTTISGGRINVFRVVSNGAPTVDAGSDQTVNNARASRSGR